jgi:hypothetical protein
MEKISWIDHVGNEELLHRVKEEWNILHTTNCLLKHIVEGKIEGRIEVMGR